ncbi:MAG: hypothetical protein K5922_10630 [Clostridiales bacterium]|nr:hypothetical protein [Clostridiales bacterium]
MKKGLSGILALILLLCLSCAAADPDLTLRDTSVRPGPWAQAYAGILEEHSEGIRAYGEYVAEVTYLSDCRPVGLTDLTGDGIPELIFLDLLEDTEYGFRVGRLWIYTGDGTGVHCMLSLQPEIDDLLYSSVYLGKGGLLTLHFNDCEMGWKIQLQPGRNGVYTAKTILTAQEDFSGEGPDSYYRNGKRISAKTWKAEVRKLEAAQGSLIGSLQVDDGGSGFTLTPEQALRELSAAEGSVSSDGIGENIGTGSENLSAGHLPELVFSPAQFVPGQKFAVYSAPSVRSWRGAKGKAAITSGSEIFAAGMTEGWILIHYELGNGLNRVGYISAEKIKGDYTAGGALSLSRTEMSLTAAAEMTDDPVHQATVIGRLKKGTKVICLAQFQGWIYVEANVSGKTARGFISPSCLDPEAGGE